MTLRLYVADNLLLNLSSPFYTAVLYVKKKKKSLPIYHRRKSQKDKREFRCIPSYKQLLLPYRRKAMWSLSQIQYFSWGKFSCIFVAYARQFSFLSNQIIEYNFQPGKESFFSPIPYRISILYLKINSILYFFLIDFHSLICLLINTLLFIYCRF